MRARIWSEDEETQNQDGSFVQTTDSDREHQFNVVVKKTDRAQIKCDREEQRPRELELCSKEDRPRALIQGDGEE